MRVFATVPSLRLRQCLVQRHEERCCCFESFDVCFNTINISSSSMSQILVIYLVITEVNSSKTAMDTSGCSKMSIRSLRSRAMRSSIRIRCSPALSAGSLKASCGARRARAGLRPSAFSAIACSSDRLPYMFTSRHGHLAQRSPRARSSRAAIASQRAQLPPRSYSAADVSRQNHPAPRAATDAIACAVLRATRILERLRCEGSARPSRTA